MPITDFSQLDPQATYSYADYLTWQLTEWVELLRGKVVRRMAGPTDRHQAVSGELHLAFGNHLRRHRCQVRYAPYDVRLIRGSARPPAAAAADAAAADAAITTVVQPDLCVICDPAKIEARGCLGAPDLIIEIVSPGTGSRDWKAKFDLYEENGVGEYWIVEPLACTIAVFVLDAATARYQSVGDFAEAGPVPCATLPGLALDWADVFPAAVA